MELFNEHKNSYFAFIQNVINDNLNGTTFKEEDIFRCLIKAGILKKNNKNKYENIELKDVLLNKLKEDGNESKNLYLLKRNNEGYYSSAIDNKVPVRASLLEMQWLRMLINDPIIKLLLDEKTIRSLEDKLKDIDSVYKQEYFSGKNIDAQDDYRKIESFSAIFKLLNRAIRERKFIRYTNEANNGSIFTNKIAFPFRLEYSAKDNKFRLSIINEEEERTVAINISNLKHAEITDGVNEEFRKKALELIMLKKTEEPLIIEIENKQNAVERCFYLFSCYDKEAYFSSEKNKHILKIYYYKFDESEIIKDLLSLGSSVTVIKPDNIRSEIITRLKKAYNCLTKCT